MQIELQIIRIIAMRKVVSWKATRKLAYKVFAF